MTETIVLKVGGMHCKSCARLIELEMEDRIGVESVVVDHESGRALVEFDPAEIDVQSIGEVIKDAGYHVDGRDDS
ncbi:MAG: heavy-metal-associated domain-containing protein [Candidatus Geothermincolia bacterium]